MANVDQNQNSQNKNSKSHVEDYSGHNWDVDAATAIEVVGSLPTGPDSNSSAETNDESTTDIQPRVGADLSDSDLRATDLSHADLSYSNLRKTILSHARLDRANLESADLRGADLRSAHLSGAQLKNAKLYGALFDQWTDLPFNKDEALLKGMIYLELMPEN